MIPEPNICTMNPTIDVPKKGIETNHDACNNAEVRKLKLSRENQELKEKITKIRSRRRTIQDQRLRHESAMQHAHSELNQAVLLQDREISNYISLRKRKVALETELQMSQSWNVLNDCFHIGTKGAFGTINGLRLGSEAPEMLAGNVEVKASGLMSNDSTDAFSELHERGGGNGIFYFDVPHQTAPQTAVFNSTIRVPWTEINAALGQVALLLVVLGERPHCGIHYRHDIQVLGCASKIGIRRNQAAVTWYNLFSDDSFQFFGKRNFNLALSGLLECVLDATLCFQKLDRTVTLPHDMIEGGNDPSIGGVSIIYSPTLEWTRACKYLLTNLKHLLTYKLLSLSFGNTKPLTNSSTKASNTG